MISLTLATALHWTDHMPRCTSFTYNRPIYSGRTNSYRGWGQPESAWGQLLCCALQRKQRGDLTQSGVKQKRFSGREWHTMSQDKGADVDHDTVAHSFDKVCSFPQTKQWMSSWRRWNSDNSHLSLKKANQTGGQWMFLILVTDRNHTVNQLSGRNLSNRSIFIAIIILLIFYSSD